MQRLRYKVGVLLGVILLLLVPTITHAQAATIKFKIAFVSGQYRVYMQPTNVTSNLTLTGQITIKVPHGVGAAQFVVNSPNSPIAGTNWSSSGRTDAPTQAPGFDYISYQLTFPTNNNQAINWTAGNELLVFTFANTGTCLGPIELIDNATDAFMPPNPPYNANVGNSMTVLTGEAYGGRYDLGSADCRDSDGDGVSDTQEDINGDGNPANDDTDGDGTPNYLDTDDDNDGIPSLTEGPTTDADTDGIPDRLEPNTADTDGDGTPNHQDADDDGDGIPTSAEDVNGDKNWFNDDADGDKIPNFLDADNSATNDSDGDGIKDTVECPSGIPCPDTDGDGKPNYMDTDDDNDGIPTLTEGATTDTDGDTVPNYLEPNTADTDGDGTPNHQDNNDDGDATPTAGEVGAGGGLKPLDADGDKIPDYLDVDTGTTDGTGGDSDGDGKKDTTECPNGIPCPDTDGDGTPDYNDVDNQVLVKAFLAGAYNQTTDLMRDDLRTKNLLPSSSPYSNATATVNAGVFAATGANAIVDWVVVELRNSTTPATVVARRAGLLQRDGDIVGMDGLSGLNFGSLTGSYYLAVQHRNHLGVMTLAAVNLSQTTTVNFTTGAGTYGTNAQVQMETGVYGLWAGDVAGDGNAILTGPDNDVSTLLRKVFSASGNENFNVNFIVPGYYSSDVNLDGQTIGSGPGNDVNFILISVFSHPGNSNRAANYIVTKQLP